MFAIVCLLFAVVWPWNRFAPDPHSFMISPSETP